MKVHLTTVLTADADAALVKFLAPEYSCSLLTNHNPCAGYVVGR